jgi:signal transduction histidine kinase
MSWRLPLFSRILFWFLSLLLVSIVGLLLTAYWLAPQQLTIRPNLLLTEMQDALWLLERAGPPAVAEYLERRDRRLGGQHQLLDAQGRNLLTGVTNRALLAIPRSDGPPQPPPFFPWNRRATPPMHVATADGAFHYIVTGSARVPGQNGRPHYELYLWVLTFVVVLCYILATTLARPIRELRQAAIAFGTGDLRRRVRVERTDEIGREFNQMADRIQTLLGAERRLLQDVSHELRSPLARLSFAVELAKSSNHPHAALERIKREAERLTALVNELINMTRAEGDPLEHKTEPIELDSFLHGLLGDLQPEAGAKQCRLLPPAASGLWVRGDAALLERALVNIVSNAIRYAPTNTDVEVTLAAADAQVAISIRDYGPGVPPPDLPRIFQPFYRVDESRNRSSGGVGLGLAIAERTILLHNGQLRAERAEPGLRVVVSLPAYAGVPARALGSAVS